MMIEHGFHKPGTSPGITTVTGNYIENGDLAIEFASHAGGPGVAFDQIAHGMGVDGVAPE